MKNINKTMMAIMLAIAIPSMAMEKSKERLNSELLYAVKANDYKAVENALKGGADPNMTGPGWSPLLQAEHYVNPNLVSLLISYGANVNARATLTGNTALHGAVVGKKHSSRDKNEYDKIIKLLLSAGADPSIKNEVGKAALDLADPETKQLIQDILSRR